VQRNRGEYFGRLTFEVRDEYSLALEPPLHFLDVFWIHAIEPIEVLGVIGRDSNGARCTFDPFGQSRRHRERVRSATRATDHGKPVDLESVRKRRDVLDTVHDSSPRLPIRLAVAGTVVSNDSGSGTNVKALAVGAFEPRARRAMKREDREAVRVPPFLEGKRATVSCLRRPRRGCHRSQSKG